MKRIFVLLLELAGLSLMVGAIVTSPTWVQLYVIGASAIVIANAYDKSK